MKTEKVKILRHARLNGVIQTPGSIIDLPEKLVVPWERGGFAERMITKDAEPEPITTKPEVAEEKPKATKGRAKK